MCVAMADVFVREQDGVPKARLLCFIMRACQQGAILTPLRDRCVLIAGEHTIIHKKGEAATVG